jgi:hypothetical protein
MRLLFDSEIDWLPASNGGEVVFDGDFGEACFVITNVEGEPAQCAAIFMSGALTGTPADRFSLTGILAKFFGGRQPIADPLFSYFGTLPPPPMSLALKRDQLIAESKVTR